VFQLQQKYNHRISAKINDLEKYTTLYSRKSSVDFCQILGVGPESVILLPEFCTNYGRTRDWRGSE